MALKPKNYAHVSLFAEHVAPVVSTLLVDVLILGLMFVSFQYVQMAIASDFAVLGHVDYWKRVGLLVLVMAFSAYNMLAYQTYLNGFRDTPENRRRGRFQAYDGPHTPRAEAGRVVLLFVLDLIQVGCAVFLFAGLVVDDPVAIVRGDLADVGRRLPLRPSLWVFVFGLLTLWHVVIFFWYAAWGWGARYQDETKRRFGLGTHQVLIPLFGVCCAVVLLLWRAHGDFSRELLGDVVNFGGLTVLSSAMIVLYSGILARNFRDFHGEGPVERSVPKDISATAYLVNESRMRRRDLSRDRFAQLWIPPPLRPEVRALWLDYADAVYPHDDVELSVRNRYFLDRLDAAAAEEERTFASLGAGFTSYPYLVATPERWRQFVEVDLPHIAHAKRLRINELLDHESLPARDVELVGADLRDLGQIDTMAERLAPTLADGSSFVLFEGVSYYLTEESLAHLFATLRRLQQPGSILALDFWKPDVVANPAFARQVAFFRDRMGFAEQDYAFLEPDALRALDGYEVVEITDVVAAEARYAETTCLGDPEETMPDEFAVLVRRD